MEAINAMIEAAIATQAANFKGASSPAVDKEKEALLARLEALEEAKGMPGGINFGHISDQRDDEEVIDVEPIVSARDKMLNQMCEAFMKNSKKRKRSKQAKEPDSSDDDKDSTSGEEDDDDDDDGATDAATIRKKLRKTKSHNVMIAMHDEPEILGLNMCKAFAYTTSNGVCAGESAMFENMEKEKEEILHLLNTDEGAQKAEAERRAESLALRILERAGNFEHAQFLEKGKRVYKHAKKK